MPKKIGVLIIHGIGDQREGFAADCIDELEHRVKERQLAPEDIAWRPIYWADILSQRESALWRNMKRGHDLNWSSIRRFIINALGDVAAYQKTTQSSNVYQQIHNRVHDVLVALRADLGGTDLPVVLLAHSLGGFIMSNYIWDLQQGLAPAAYRTTALERMETLAGIVTFGCTIPVLTLPYDPVQCIAFPPPNLIRHFPPGTDAAALAQAARWENYYDPEDVLGYPLKPLSDGYAKVVHADKEIEVGGLLTSWNPAAHVEYWTDRDFTKEAAGLICGVLQLA